jgi:hypothetical protein
LLLLFFLNIEASYLDYIYKDRNPSLNSFGQTGLIQTPSAESLQEGSAYLSFNNNDLYRYNAITVAPFNWLEASFFYYRPHDMGWGGQRGFYLDKGFNVKLSHQLKILGGPSIAVGLNDFAGTGLMTSEYIVTTLNKSNIKYTFGIGWGAFSSNSGFSNPLGLLHNSFKTRKPVSSNYDLGGNFSNDLWFRGDAAFFGGFEWFVPKGNGLKLKVEYDPFNYQTLGSFRLANFIDKELRRKDSNVNYGISYRFSKYIDMDLSFIKGNSINLRLSFGSTFNNKNAPKKSYAIKKISSASVSGDQKYAFYNDLLLNLNRNQLLLQTTELKNEVLKVSISSESISKPLISAYYASSISSEVSKQYSFDIDRFEITHVNAGVELNKISFRADAFENNLYKDTLLRKHTNIKSGMMSEYLNNEFKPRVIFPAIFSSTGPGIETHIGRPDQPFYYSFTLKNNTQIQFSRNSFLTTEIDYPITDGFDDLISRPGSNLEHVRTDIVDYLRAPGFRLKRLQADYIWSPYKNLYTKISGGMFEQMFGGLGFETLYKPFNKNFSIGYEYFSIKQRGYNQRFDFKDYKVNTHHLSANYFHPKSGLMARLSHGKYLAGDRGFTFDFSRRTNSGFVAGIFLTRTNVSAEDFGEGSFDKGFYFQIPFNLFSSKYSRENFNFKYKPMTRDGGQKLEYQNDLVGLIHNAAYSEIYKDWNEIN